MGLFETVESKRENFGPVMRFPEMSTFPCPQQGRGIYREVRKLAETRPFVENYIKARVRDADQQGLAKRRIPLVEELTSRSACIQPHFLPAEAQV